MVKLPEQVDGARERGIPIGVLPARREGNLAAADRIPHLAIDDPRIGQTGPRLAVDADPTADLQYDQDALVTDASSGDVKWRRSQRSVELGRSAKPHSSETLLGESIEQ